MAWARRCWCWPSRSALDGLEGVGLLGSHRGVHASAPLAQLRQLMGQYSRQQPRAWHDHQTQLPQECEGVQLEPVLHDPAVDESVELEASERHLPVRRREPLEVARVGAVEVDPLRYKVAFAHGLLHRWLKTSIHRRDAALLRSARVASLGCLGLSGIASGVGIPVTFVAPFLNSLMLRRDDGRRRRQRRLASGGKGLRTSPEATPLAEHFTVYFLSATAAMAANLRPQIGAGPGILVRSRACDLVPLAVHRGGVAARSVPRSY